MVLIVYSDYACPFAYVGHRRVARLRAQGRLDAVDWRPFELHPEIPVQGVPRPRGGGGAGTLRALLEEDGLSIRPSPVAWNSRLALLAAEHARDLAVHEAVHDRLFAAAWEEGQDLGRPEIQVTHHPGTREVADAEVWFSGAGSSDLRIRVTPLRTVYLKGGSGYQWDGRWGHGVDQGGLVVEGVTHDVADPVSRAELTWLNETLCRFETSDGRVGYGMYENLCAGLYRPLGYESPTDVA